MLILSSQVWGQSTDLMCLPYQFSETFDDFSGLHGHLQNMSIPEELISIRKVTYKRNLNAKYCTRPTDMIDTIVLHHSETAPDTSAEIINRMHLARTTNRDQWYMIGYSFTLNAPYPNGQYTPLKIQASEGRPIDIVGAHAGGEAFVKMDKVQKKLWNEGKIRCGQEGGEFKVDPKELIKNGKIKANVTTIGLVVIGNYAPFSENNPSGYPEDQIRNPTKETLDGTARLACQLQKKYPRMKKIKWHSNFKATECPGTIQHFVPEIIKIAKDYGCSFE